MDLDRHKLLATGVVGSTLAAIFCFTPALAVLLGTIGLSAWLGWADTLLLPALGLFLAMTVYGLFLRQRPKWRH